MTTSDTTGAAAFLDAIKAGDMDRARALLDADPTLVRATVPGGISVLMMATYYQRHDLVDLLIGRGAVVDIFAAAALGRMDSLRSWLQSDASLINTDSPDGWTPLHLAAHFGQVDAVRLLLAAGADVQARSRNGLENIPLHAALAASHQRDQVARLLIDAGSDVNARQHSGFTPLHAAAQHGDLALAQLLLDRGAFVDAKTDDGRTALSLAAEHEHAELAGLLRSRGAAESPARAG